MVHQFEKGLELEREMELDDLVPWVGFLLSRFPIVPAIFSLPQQRFRGCKKSIGISHKDLLRLSESFGYTTRLESLSGRGG
jgi:hypothetical protein